MEIPRDTSMKQKLGAPQRHILSNHNDASLHTCYKSGIATNGGDHPLPSFREISGISAIACFKVDLRRIGA